MKFDFFTLRVSLFSVSHSWTLANSSFINNSYSSKSLPGQKRLVSSANKIVDKLLVELLRSLMYIKNSNGPRIDPCGTPQVIIFSVDLMLLYLTICFLLERIFDPSMIFATNTIKIKVF